MYVCMYVCMYTHTHTYIYIYIFVCACVYVYVRVTVLFFVCLRQVAPMALAEVSRQKPGVAGTFVLEKPLFSRYNE